MSKNAAKSPKIEQIWAVVQIGNAVTQMFMLPLPEACQS